MYSIDFKPRLFSTLKSYSREDLIPDVIAGIIVGIVALPMAIAFAIGSNPSATVDASGNVINMISPERGIITAIIAGFIISALGGSKVQIGGPTGAFMPIIAGIMASYNIEGLCIATFMAGIFLILLGVFKLGNAIKFVPYPIIIGFTSGVAVTIFTKQIEDFLGMHHIEKCDTFLGKWSIYLQNLSSTDLWSLGFGVATIAIILITPKFTKKIPGSFVAVVLMTVIAYFVKQYYLIPNNIENELVTIGERFGEIKATLPSAPDFSTITYEKVRGLLSPAFAIAILGAIESLLSAAVADGAIGDRHNSNTELIAQGLANIASPLAGGVPATGAIARTMTNINNGGRSPIAGIIHAVVLLVIFILLMPFAGYIPMACMSGILIIISYNMSGWRSFKAQLNNPKSDVAVLLVTFLLTVIFDLIVAIELGIVLGCLLFIFRIAKASEVKVISDEIDPNTESDMQHIANDEHLIIPEGVEVYEINGPFFFGVSNKFEELMVSFGDRPKVRIIRMRRVPFVDSTGIHNLANLCEMSQKEGIKVVLSGVNPTVHKSLEKSGFYQILGQDNICPNINIALEKANQILKEV